MFPLEVLGKNSSIVFQPHDSSLLIGLSIAQSSLLMCIKRSFVACTVDTQRPGVTDMASAPEEPNTDTPLMTTSGGVESSKLKSEAVVSWVGAGICVAAAILFIFL